MCVLYKNKGFNGHIFLEKMSRLNRGFHVLVTSRDAEDYFSDPKNIQDLQIEKLQWTKQEVETWCDKYCQAKEEKKAWRNSFLPDFRSLPSEDDNDHRKEVLCVPLILYICGHSEISLWDHESIGSIYNDAFRNVILRKHLTGQGDYTELTEAERKSNLIAWQYTKEIAYQMFLLDTLDLAESNDPDNKYATGLKNARARTKTVLQEKYGIIVPDDALAIKKELALCPFMMENDETGGITFAHKTVYEYFTAVKLYEDYFATFNKSYFDNPYKSAKATEDVIMAAIAAFRYKATPMDIFQYLCGMNDAPFSGEKKKASDIGLDYGMFEKAYIKAMDDRILDKLTVTAPVEEYIYLDYLEPMQENPITAQVIRAFRALTCFLTGHGFQNKNGNKASKRFRSFLVLSEQNISIMGWDLRGAHFGSADFQDANLRDADLSNADLSNADLSSAKLTGAELTRAELTRAKLNRAKLSEAKLTRAKLTSADLTEAKLTRAKLSRADLTRAKLTSADLTGAKLIGADLTDAKLTDAKLTGAKYSKDPEYRTQFPVGFDPDAHGMIEVDIKDIIDEDFLSIIDTDL